jgi:hypothetical protein
MYYKIGRVYTFNTKLFAPIISGQKFLLVGRKQCLISNEERALKCPDSCRGRLAYVGDDMTTSGHKRDTLCGYIRTSFGKIPLYVEVKESK